MHERTYRVIVEQFVALTQWLHPQPPAEGWRGVVLPFLHQPVVGDGVLFLPDTPLISSTAGLDMNNATVFTHFVAQKVAWAWWANVFEGRTMIEKQQASSQQPQGSTLFSTSIDVQPMLAEYSSAVMSEQTGAKDMLARQMTICAQVRQANPKTNPGSSGVPHELDGQRMALGIEDCTDQAALLYHFYQKDGAAKVMTLLQQVTQDDQGKTGTMREFLATAQRVLQRDVTIEAGPILCGKSKGAQSGRDPLSCLDVNEVRQ
jgi:hypothetical protein